MRDPDGRPGSKLIHGMLLMIGAVISFTLLDSTAKFLSRDLPVIEVIWARYFFSLLAFPVFFGFSSAARAFRTERPWIQIGRALLLVGATAAMFFAVRYLPLVETYALTLISPFFVSILAVMILGEKVPAWHWAAIAFGFAGAMIALQPGSGIYSWPAIFPILMAICWAFYQIITRMIREKEPPLTTLFFTMLVGTVCLTPAMPFHWAPPSAASWALIAFMGFIGLIGQFLLIKAYAMAEASVLSPFVYTQIIWSSVIGFLVFDDIPAVSTLIGAAIIIASGLMIMLRPKTRQG